MKITSLKDALDQGLEAFERAESSRQEIRDLFESLDETIKAATAGKVLLGVQEIHELARPLETGGLAGTLEYFGRALRGENDLAVWNRWMLRTVGADGQTKAEELFRAQISRHGYPVSLKFFDERYICHDRESLESTLQDLLRRPDVGGKLRKLMAVPS